MLYGSTPGRASSMRRCRFFSFSAHALRPMPADTGSPAYPAGVPVTRRISAPAVRVVPPESPVCAMLYTSLAVCMAAAFIR